MLGSGPGELVHVERLPVNVGGPSQPKIDHSSSDGRIGVAIDQNEAARVPVLRVRIEGKGLRGRDIAIADLVERQGLDRKSVV